MKAELNRSFDYPHRELVAKAQSGKMIRHHFVSVDDPDFIDRIAAFGWRTSGFPSCPKDLLKE